MSSLKTEYFDSRKEFDRKDNLVSVNYDSKINKFKVVTRNETDKINSESLAG